MGRHRTRTVDTGPGRYRAFGGEAAQQTRGEKIRRFSSRGWGDVFRSAFSVPRAGSAGSGVYWHRRGRMVGG